MVTCYGAMSYTFLPMAGRPVQIAMKIFIVAVIMTTITAYITLYVIDVDHPSRTIRAGREIIIHSIFRIFT
ncbi:MAG: hypothetical protein LBS55_06060 [Prevotellaceae bacterium]|nr:hypothetical protein [Prevotellaceae bacterium]